MATKVVGVEPVFAHTRYEASAFHAVSAGDISGASYFVEMEWARKAFETLSSNCFCCYLL